MRKEVELAIVVLALGTPGGAAQDTPAKEEIRALVEDLGSPDYATREAAEARLLEVGDPARPFLEEAVKSEDSEVSSRAGRILVRMRFHFLRGGKIEAWNGEIARQLLSHDVAEQKVGASRLASFIADVDDNRLPEEAVDEARRVLRLVWEPQNGGDRETPVLMALFWLGDADAIAAMLSTVSPVQQFRGRELNEMGAVYRGTLSAVLEATSRVEGAGRIAGCCLAIAVVRRDETAGRAMAEENMSRAMELARGLDPASHAMAGLVRGGLLVRLGKLAGLDEFLDGLAALNLRDQVDWGEACLSAYQPAAKLPELVVAAAKHGEAALGTLMGGLMSWFTHYAPDEFAGLLGHPEPRVREIAASAAGLLKIEAQKAALPPLLSDPVYEVRLAAAWSLGEFGETEAARGAARSALASENHEEVRDALWLLVELRDAELADRALPFLADARPDVRAAAAYALARRVRPVPVAVLEPLLADTAACRFYPGANKPLEEGTVGEAVRGYLGR